MIRDVDSGYKDIDALHQWIARLVAERQALREAAADTASLERNRLEICRLQHRLSEVLIRVHAAAHA